MSTAADPYASDSPDGGASAFATRSLTIAALIVAGGFLGSRLLGLLRSVIIANTFGTRPELDAYWVAFRLPDLVFQLLAGATLASAFIPSFAGIRVRDGEAAAWRLASSVLNLVLLATGVFAIAAFLMAPVLVPFYGAGPRRGYRPAARAHGFGRETDFHHAGLACAVRRIRHVHGHPQCSSPLRRYCPGADVLQPGYHRRRPRFA